MIAEFCPVIDRGWGGDYDFLLRIRMKMIRGVGTTVG